MGSYAQLRIDGYDFQSYYGCIDAHIGTVFTEQEKFIERQLGDGDSAPDIRCGYRAPCSVIRDRLDLLGFSDELAREVYAERRAAERDQRKAMLDDDRLELLWEDSREHIAFLESFDFGEWLGVVTSLISRRVSRSQRDDVTLTSKEKFIFLDDDECYGYAPVEDRRLLLRAVLSALPDVAIVELEFSDLVAAGECNAVDHLTVDCRNSLVEDFPTNRSVIILTEGSSDIAVLECALRNVFPHLVEYFTFYDFHSSNARGGAPTLVDTVKAFAAARISDRVVALFDNDTAAHDALRSLKNVPLPNNIRCVTYPPLDLAKCYPTIGPTGLATLDVNGLAGAIELYLGRDVLIGEDGMLTPVHWRGYVASLSRYQGELTSKEALRKRFFKIVEEWKANASAHPSRDWSGLTEILNLVRTAHLKPSRLTQV